MGVETMSLKLLGKAPCPFCGLPANVGISRDGEGLAVHLICGPCQTQVQAHRDGKVGKKMGRMALGPPEAAQAQ